MIRLTKAAFLIAALAIMAPGAASAAKLRVAASTNDLASIAASVGGDRVEAFAIARPNSDAHRVEVLPSYMVKVARARLYLKVGLGLDAWADAIIAGSRNRGLTVVDCSSRIEVLEKPAGRVDASMGHVHPEGNPHYWLDPRNGAVIAGTIAEALAAADPAGAAGYRERAAAFARETAAAFERQRAAVDRMPVKRMLTYHASWVYFANAFGIAVTANVEPVPGIPPTARHLASLVRTVKAERVPVLLQEPYFSPDAGRFLTRETGIRVVVAAPSCDAPSAGSYLAHFDAVAARLAPAGGTR